MLLQKLVFTVEFLLHVAGSSRYERKQPKKITYLTRLSYPSGMVISQEGHLIVAGWLNDYITIINTDSGEKINRFGQYGSGQVRGTEGVSLTQDGHIIVADTYNNRLQVLTVEGALGEFHTHMLNQVFIIYAPSLTIMHDANRSQAWL